MKMAEENKNKRFEVLNEIIGLLESLEDDEKENVLRSACVFCNVLEYELSLTLKISDRKKLRT